MKRKAIRERGGCPVRLWLGPCRVGLLLSWPSPYDARKRFLLDDVNVIHTVWLRAEMIPEPHQTEVREFLLNS
jgi:hypothetical protein